MKLIGKIKLRMQELNKSEEKLLVKSFLSREYTAHHLSSISLICIFLFIFCTIIWSAVAEVKEIARAEGEIITSGKSQVIQHQDGGIVSEIHVKDGDRVLSGQKIITLNGESASLELNKIAGKINFLNISREHILAMLEDREPDFSKYGLTPEEVTEQQVIYDGKLAALSTESEVIQKQIVRNRENMRSYLAEANVLQKNESLIADAYSMQKNLYDRGLANKMIYMKKKEELNSHRARIQMAHSQVAMSNAEHSELTSRIQMLKDNSRRDALKQLEEINSEMAVLEEELGKIKVILSRLEITSPVNGIVKGLKINTIGSVIGSGEKIAEIVPVQEELVANVKILPEYVGRVKLGQPVYIKIDSFDYVRFGVVHGVLQSVSANTFTDDMSNVYYTGRVKLEKKNFSANGVSFDIIPGMTLDADIVTGSKSLLNYLLRPIHAAAITAFSEE